MRVLGGTSTDRASFSRTVDDNCPILRALCTSTGSWYAQFSDSDRQPGEGGSASPFDASPVSCATANMMSSVNSGRESVVGHNVQERPSP